MQLVYFGIDHIHSARGGRAVILRIFAALISGIGLLTGTVPPVQSQPISPEEFSRSIEEELRRLEDAPPSQPPTQAAATADLDGLRVAFEQAVAAINARDLDAFTATWHDQVVAFEQDAPFAVDGKAARQRTYQTFFAAAETLTFTPINPQFRIVGDMGVVWGYYARQVKPKDGPSQTHFGRLTLAYTRADGRWLVGAIHISRLPSGN